MAGPRGEMRGMSIGTGGGDPATGGTIDELISKLANLDLHEIDADALRDAEFQQIQMILDSLVGKTIKRALVEDRRIVLETTDGSRFFFYGFMGGGA
jgi:hypothetical protein